MLVAGIAEDALAGGSCQLQALLSPALFMQLGKFFQRLHGSCLRGFVVSSNPVSGRVQ